MSSKSCSAINCLSTEIVAMQRQIKVFVWPPSNGTDDQQKDQTSLPTEIIDFQYFCKDHFDRTVIRKKSVRLLSAKSLNKVENSLKNVVNSYSRKRKTNNLHQRQTKQIKAKDTGKSYTLHEATNSADNTKVDVSFNEFNKFDSDEYEDSVPTFVGAEDGQSAQLTEDNDCVITANPAPTIIDLSDDENPDCQDGSNKMIDLILCNDIEPEPSLEEAKEYEIEIADEDEELQQPLRINFTMCSTLRDDEDDASESIDLTDEQNDCQTLATVDLTDERMSREDANVDDSTNAVIEEIRGKLNSRYPDSLQAIKWNDETKQFEIIISKRSGGLEVDKRSGAFHQYLREVVNHAIQCKGSLDPATERTSHEKSSGQVNENIILNKDYASKQQEMLKSLETNKKTANAPHRVNALHDGDSLISTSDSLMPVTSAHLSGKTQIVSNYNATQILKKSELYLGVTAETFKRIEKLLDDRFIKRSCYVLILVLRKIKLNESFSILSDVLCPKKDDCFHIYRRFLVEISHTLQGCLRWPTTDRWEPLAIVDLFEMEIQKPDSFVEQSVSFCSQTQRYTAKFAICCTSTGYITHVSQPFFTIQDEFLISCLHSIPKNSSVVMNPNIFRTKIATRIVSLFDCDHQNERNLIRRVFDRMRRFSLLSSISDKENVNLLHHTVSVVACLCNMETEAK